VWSRTVGGDDPALFEESTTFGSGSGEKIGGHQRQIRDHAFLHGAISLVRAEPLELLSRPDPVVSHIDTVPPRRDSTAAWLQIRAKRRS
jgi:hypothetical protein